MKNFNWTLLPAGLCLAIVASVLTGKFASPRAQAQDGDQAAGQLGKSLQEMQQDLARLQDEQKALRDQLETFELRAPEKQSTRSAVGLVDIAVARWMTDNAPALGQAAALSASAEALDEAALEASVLSILRAGSTPEERDAQWQMLIEKGQLKAVVAYLEDMVLKSPGDSDLQYSLAEAYNHRSFEVGQGPLMVVFGEKADAAYDRVLNLDDQHWNARFGKALTLSRQPSMLGKSGEAIREFKTLIAQQERGNSEAHFAQSYFFLGNLYNERGQAGKAADIWREGLTRFPDNDSLQQQLASNSGGN